MSHPAKFSLPILERAVEMLDRRLADDRCGGESQLVTVLDPFAGTGKGVDYLRARGYAAEGIDLEPVDAWGEADVSSHVRVGNALELEYDDGAIDVVFTSPSYGNRFADVDMRASVAGTYAKGLGRRATEGSSCHLQWGTAYREFHQAAWLEARRVLAPGGLFLLNISDHYRAKVPVAVSAWHVKTLVGFGFEWVAAEAIDTSRLTHGANPTRCEVEWLHLLKRTGA